MTTPRIMLTVLAALLPGTAALVYVFGLGVIWNIAILCLACVVCELVALTLKGLTWRASYTHIQDHSALLTAWLIGICLPPFVPAAHLFIAAAASIGLAKHAYGGLGRNIFNPAMVGYAVILVSFPQSLAQWPSLGVNIDALSGATLLSDFRYRTGLTVAEFDLRYAAALAQQKLIALGFAIGGIALLYKKLIAWRIPAGMLGALCLCALFGYDQGSSTSWGGALFHAMAGGFVAAAFFVATDPVTHPHQNNQQLVFGALIGTLIYVIRATGSFPDGIAFAVLLANCCTPLLNRLATNAAKPKQAQAADG